MNMPADRATECQAYCRRVAANFAGLAAAAETIAAAAAALEASIAAGGTIFFCGNGGSAADAQHLAAELTGRYRRERAPIAAVALTVDSSALTAIGNDYGFEVIFARQLRALARAGDCLVAISTSGASENVVAAAEVAREAGLRVVALTGQGGGALAGLADIWIAVPAREVNHIQEMHIAVGHMLCDFVERGVADG